MANPHYEILTAVRDHLATPAISNLGTPAVREIPYVLSGVDTPPLCLVCPPVEPERLHKQTFARGAWWEYPVLVLLITAGNRALQSGVQARLQTRYDVRQRLFVPTIDGLSTHDCNPEPRVVSDVQAALGSNYHVSGFLFWLRKAEQRVA